MIDAENTTPLTDDEKQQLIDYSAWVPCPFCKGVEHLEQFRASFCILCKNFGRILNGTLNVAGFVFDDYLAQEGIIKNLRVEIVEMRRVIAQSITQSEGRHTPPPRLLRL